MVAHGWVQVALFGGLLLVWIIGANARRRHHSARMHGKNEREKLS